MFKKLKEQLSCIECASVRAEDFYMTSKQNVPMRKPELYDMERRPRTNSLPSTHGNPHVNVSRSSNHMPHGQNFNNSRSYQTLPNTSFQSNRSRSGHRGRRTPSVDSAHTRSMDNFQHHQDPQPHISTFGDNPVPLNYRLGYPNKTASLDRHTHYNTSERTGRRQHRGPPPVRRSNSVSSPLVRHHNIHQNNWTGPVNEKQPHLGLNGNPAPERSSSVTNLYNERKSEVDGHFVQALTPQPERRPRSVSFAGNDPNGNKHDVPRRRSSSISDVQPKEDRPLSLCGDGLSSSLVSIVKKEWHSQTHLASDNEGSSTGKRQMKSILKNSNKLKLPGSLDSSSDFQEERKPRGNSVTFADVEHNTSKSSTRKNPAGFRQRMPLKFSSKGNHSAANVTRTAKHPGFQGLETPESADMNNTIEHRTVKSNINPSSVDNESERLANCEPLDTESSSNDGARVNHKPPLPLNNRIRNIKDHISDDSDNKQNGNSSGASEAIGVGIYKSSNPTKDHNRVNDNDSCHGNQEVTIGSTSNSPKTIPRRSIQKHAPFCSSSIDSDNCSSSISSDSSSQNAKLRSVTQVREIPRSPSPVVKGKKEIPVRNDSTDSTTTVPNIKKNRSLGKKKKRSTSATVKLSRVDSDTTDSGLSMDNNLSPVSAADNPFDSIDRHKNRALIPGSSLDNINLLCGQTRKVPLVNQAHYSTLQHVKHAPRTKADYRSQTLEDASLLEEPLPFDTNISHHTGIVFNSRDVNHNEKLDINNSNTSELVSASRMRIKSENIDYPFGSSPRPHLKNKPTNISPNTIVRTTNSLELNPPPPTRTKRPLVKQGSLDTSHASTTSSEDSIQTTRNRPRRNSFDEMMNSSSSRIVPRTPPLPPEELAGFRPESHSTEHRKRHTKESTDEQHLHPCHTRSHVSQDTIDWTLSAEDLPGSNTNSLSPPSVGDVSDITISCGDRSMMSFMGQNDFSRVMIPREDIRTGRLMMKDEGNTFCMCAGNFRISTKHKTATPHFVPVTVQIYRGLNDKEDRINLLKNTMVLLSLQHRNIHKVYGLCMEGSPHTRDGREVLILLERTHYLVTLNKLLTWISENNAQLMTTWCAINFALQMGDALAFLEKKGIIHANLSSNSIRIDKQCNLKLGGIEQFPFSSTTAPIRWMSLETLSRGQILPKSAVWTFGVILWEILSVGCRPYQNLKTGQILSQLSKGYRLPCPQMCSSYLFNILMHCWQPRPDDRPDFEKLNRILYEYQLKLPSSKPPAELFPDREDFWEILHEHV